MAVNCISHNTALWPATVALHGHWPPLPSFPRLSGFSSMVHFGEDKARKERQPLPITHWLTRPLVSLYRSIVESNTKQCCLRYPTENHLQEEGHTAE